MSDLERQHGRLNADCVSTYDTDISGQTVCLNNVTHSVSALSQLVLSQREQIENLTATVARQADVIEQLTSQFQGMTRLVQGLLGE